ncbi:MAG: Type IV pilus assembly protein PilM [Parcubacteria group bacterium GW2011_GWA2_51_10]|nr:MAG: Type IV pilus assembly protein PilM [Parcubacteria group bacterium GW2011_GWA2_51_10]
MVAFSLGKLFGRSQEGSILGIDIGASSAKVVQLRASKGAAILETYGEIALGPYGNAAIGKAVKLPPEKIAEALTDLMREANVTARTGGLSIPFSASLVSIIDLPKVDDDALARMVPIEARKYIPIPISEVTLDWFVIPREEEGASAFDRVEEPSPLRAKGQEVLLVAIHNATVKNYQAIASAIGVKVHFFEIEIFSEARSSMEHGTAPVLVVDIGAAMTKMYIVERGIVRLTHLVTTGGQHMTDTLARSLSWDFEKAERVKRERGLIDSSAYGTEENAKIKSALLSTLARVFAEVDRVLLSYGQRYNKNVSHVLFAGGGASLPGLKEHAKTALRAEVTVADPFARAEAPAFLKDVLQQIGPGFAVSIGLALRELKHL